MTPLDIIQHAGTNLPISYTKSFKESLIGKLKDFGELINRLKYSSNLHFDIKQLQERSLILQRGILKTLDAYYEGNPSKSYNMLCETLKDCKINEYLDKEHYLPSNSSLFRIRTCEENYPLSKRELFHIPFEMRGKVKTQRYSIPGLPSLYLANSIFTAWEELKRPPAQSIHAIKLTNNLDLRLLDLTTDFFAQPTQFLGEIVDDKKIEYNLMVWPLLAACSFKVLSADDPFKPEYIIPQLLLQWAKKELVDGIKYSSTHIDLNTSKHGGFFYNIVLPVKNCNIEEGYCSKLINMFKSTQVLPYSLSEIVTSSNRFYAQGSIHSKINKDIRKIEIIKAHPQPYYQTIFGILEHNLNALKLEDF
ncbi:hypothetical protein ACR78I_22725 [Sphingobacterium multivorum]|uniref:hypothetical protein n=1 Tax=Sphingobacterium multivorum TaxID=28454 RepID=UPI003DA4080E